MASSVVAAAVDSGLASAPLPPPGQELAGRRVLLIAYLFPPMGGISVQRALSLAKYLPEHGCDMHVLTAWNAASPVKDPGLLAHVPPSVRVHQSFTPEIPFHVRHKIWGWLSRPSGKPATETVAEKKPAEQRRGVKAAVINLARRIMCPEPEVVWVPFALQRARRVVRKHKIDTVIVTAPPFSAFLIGNALKREFPKLTYISDFRDEWLTFYLKDFEFQSGAHTRRRAEEIERATVELSDRVIAVTLPSLRRIRERYPEQPESKFVCVANGYDPASFQSFTARAHGTGKTVVTHMGTVYKTATPKFYLDALSSLPEDLRERLETRFVGRISDAERASMESSSAGGGVKVLGFMPQAKALGVVEETDYLLLTLTDEVSLPGKLFEYLVTGKPILAISPLSGEVARVIQETGSGWCVDPTDRQGLVDLLAKAASGNLPAIQPKWDVIRSYERPRLVARYSSVLRSAASAVCVQPDRR